VLRVSAELVAEAVGSKGGQRELSMWRHSWRWKVNDTELVGWVPTIDLPHGQEHMLDGNAGCMGRRLWWLEAQWRDGDT
jgi:hypothetical protein